MVIRWIASLGKRRHWVQAFAALLIFGSGLVIGSAGTFAMLKDRIDVRPGFRPMRGDPSRFVEFLVHDWQSRYQLTDDQVSQLKPVLIQQFKALGNIFKAADKQAQTLEKPWLNKIKQIMTSDQYAQWYKDYERWRERRRGPRNYRRQDRDRHGRSHPRRYPDAGPDGPPLGPRPDGPPGPGAPIPEVNSQTHQPGQ